jgi:hypothetical protein
MFRASSAHHQESLNYIQPLVSCVDVCLSAALSFKKENLHHICLLQFFVHVYNLQIMCKYETRYVLFIWNMRFCAVQWKMAREYVISEVYWLTDWGFSWPDWGFSYLNKVFPCFYLSYNANARLKLAKRGHGPHSSTLFVICVVICVVLCIVCV